jgi:sugar lactone lactonase YvrE
MKNPKRSWIRRATSASAILSLMMAVFNIAPTSTEAARSLKGGDNTPKSVTRAGSEMLIGLTSTNTLVMFNSDTPGTILRNISVTGLVGGDTLVGIDFRPARGILVGVGSGGRVYNINTASGAATLVGSFTFPAPNSTNFAVDFNPVPDAIRVIGEIGRKNFRVSPNNGALLGTDTDVAYVDANSATPPQIAACAYTNNFLGARRTTLYDIDSNLNLLARQGGLNFAAGDLAVAPQTDGNPNAGQLVSVGALGVDTTNIASLDISDFSGTAFAALNPLGTGTSNLYTVNLNTGAASLVGSIGSGLLITSITTGFNGENLVALTTSNKLLSFNSAMPGVITRSVQITGLLDNLVGIDFRPATGQLFGVSNSRLYSINRFTGAATVVTTFATRASVNFGIDFNPVPDAVRIVGDNTENLRVPLATLTLAIDTPVTFAAGDVTTNPPFIVGSAYDRNVSGAGAPTQLTTLYNIDSRNGTAPARLVLQGGIDGAVAGGPNAGMLTTVGTGTFLNVTTTSEVGFDISGTTNSAFASMTPTAPGNVSNLYTINVGTGTSTLIGAIGGGEVIRDISVVNNVEIVLGLLNTSNSLITFASTAPNRLLNTGGATGVPVTGLTAGDVLQGLDLRPATGEILALGTQGTTARIYRLNLTGNAQTGQITAASATPLLAAGFAFPAQGVAQGTDFGYDFNPVPDRIRIVSNTRQDLRANPNTGGLAATDGLLTYITGDPNAGLTPSVVTAAYDRNFAGTLGTTLYVMDSRSGAAQGILAAQGGINGAAAGGPNSGVLVTIAPMTTMAGAFTFTNVAGFDISGISGQAIAALQPMGSTSSNLYTINLSTGLATQVTTLPIGGAAPLLVRDITFGLSAAALAGLGQENATIYAADTSNNRIQRSVDDGLTWSVVSLGAGVAAGQFNQPRAVAADITGRIIFAADTGNNRIQRSTDGGVTWTVIATAGTLPNQVNQPQGVAYDQLADTLYVADTNNNRILSFTAASTLTPVASIYAGATAGNTVGKFNQPTGLSVDAQGRLYVCDTLNNRLQRNTNNTATGWEIFAGATAGVAPGLVNAPRGIFVDSTGRVFVADTGNNRIMVNVGGLGGWSSILLSGTIVGSVNAPRGVTLSSTGALLIGDTGNNRIQRRAADGGALLRGAPGLAVGQFSQPSGLN